MAKKKSNTQPKRTPKATVKSKTVNQSHTSPKVEYLFERRHFYLVGISLVLMILGMMLMIGGAMPNPDVWEPNLIYSSRRLTLAPIAILAGLGVLVYTIFKR